jgi:hypothetical protein
MEPAVSMERAVWRRAAWAALFVVNVSGLAALAEWRNGQDILFLLRFGIVNPAEANPMRPEYRKIIDVGNIPEYSNLSSTGLNLLDLRPIKGLGWTELPEAMSSIGWDSSGHVKSSFQKFRFVGNVQIIEGQLSLPVRHERLGMSFVKDCNGDEDWFVCRNRAWNYCFDIDVECGTLALDESPTLERADSSQDTRKKSYDPGPSDHGPIKGTLTLAVIFLGGWLGVWSIGFWDSLGGWRWLLSALGWAAMIGAIVQGLPVRP